MRLKNEPTQEEQNDLSLQGRIYVIIYIVPLMGRMHGQMVRFAIYEKSWVKQHMTLTLTGMFERNQ